MHKLSKTAKMPGKSWSIPATRCKRGSKLAKCKGSICASCYARKGSYRYPSVMNLRENNYQEYMLNPDKFVEDLTTLIQAEYLKTGVPYFRWFDSGDLQSYKMLTQIMEIASNLPHINFWLPTKEVDLLYQFLGDEEHRKNPRPPKNLNIRLSVVMIDDAYAGLEIFSESRVISKNTTPLKSEIVCGGNCIECNYACWLSKKPVAYVKH